MLDHQIQTPQEGGDSLSLEFALHPIALEHSVGNIGQTVLALRKVGQLPESERRQLVSILNSKTDLLEQEPILRAA